MRLLLYQYIDTLAYLFIIAIILRAVISWFPISPHNPFSQLLFRITEPILAPLRRSIPRLGMLDITPLIAILLIRAAVYLFYYLLVTL